MASTTADLEKAARDSGDDFLGYLYGMALLHLRECTDERNDRIDNGS